MVQRYEQTRKLQWYKRGAAYEVGFTFHGKPEDAKINNGW